MTDEKLKTLLTQDFPGESRVIYSDISAENILTCEPRELPGVFGKLKSERYGFDFLANLTAVEYENNFTMVYNFRSLENKIRLTLKAALNKDNPVAPSAAVFWKTADWQEREVFDMFGIKFEGHPNLKKILLTDDFEGYPLRKDFEYKNRRTQPLPDDPELTVMR